MLSVFVATALTACAGGNPAGVDAPAAPRIASAVIQPGVVSLGPQQALKFTADIRDEAGRSVTTPVTWQATGGSIDASGMYVAGAVHGEYEVRALSLGQMLGLARIKIDSLMNRTAPGGGDGGQGDKAATISISPTSLRLDTGASRQFSVDLRDGDGQPLADPVTWTATGGSVTTTGFFVAGSTPGNFRVTVTARGVSAHADVVVEGRDADVYVVVGQPGSLNGSERDLLDRLSASLGAVQVLDDDGLTASTTSGCRLVVMSKTVDAATIGTKLKGVTCGVLFWEDNQQKLDMLATVPNDGSNGTSWNSSSSTVYVHSNVPSELRAGLAGTVSFYQSGYQVTHSPSGNTLPSGAVVVAEMYQGSSRKAIYAYERGRSLADGSTAAGRRVYFGLHDDTFQRLTGDGLRLFDAAAGWAAAPPSTTPAPPPTQSPSSPTAPTQVPQGIEIYPGQSIQAAVDANPAGTTFVIKTGVHRQQRVQPKDRMTFAGEPGAVMTGENTTDYAFRGTATGVTIQGLVIERYEPGAQMGAVKGGGHQSSESSDGWIVRNNEIRYNDGGGVRIGHRMILKDNHIHHNEQIGVVGVGDDVLVEGNEIAFNNYNKKHSYGWEAGGTKFVKTRNLVVRNNHVHDNWGPGLWTDIDNIDTLYEGNLVEDNADSGIFHEISYKATIRNNTIRRNGFDRVGAWAYGAGILVAHSPDVEVYGNVVEENQNGIMGVQQDRGSGDYGPHELRNLNVHDNTVIQRTKQWAAGVAQDVGDSGVFARNIRFDDNRYTLGSGDGRDFEWQNGQRTPDQWQDYGNDGSGVFNW